jgi:hypothetical protein
MLWLNCYDRSRQSGRRACVVKRVTVLRPLGRHLSPLAHLRAELEAIMISLLIGVGAFLLAVIASATFDPRRSREGDDDDDHAHAMDVTTLPV